MLMTDELFSLVAPLTRSPVLEPEDRCRCIGRNMLLVWRINRCIRVRWHEYLDRVVRVADRLVVKAANDPLIGHFLAGF